MTNRDEAPHSEPGWAGPEPWGRPVPGPFQGHRQHGSYADGIRAEELVPAEERRITELESKIRGPLRGTFKIGVMGKGGVGKTTVSACIRSIRKLRAGSGSWSATNTWRLLPTSAAGWATMLLGY